MKVRPLAQSPPPSVPSGASVQAAARALRKLGCGALLVLDRGKLVGVVSERDLVHRVVGRGLDARTTRVRQVMSKPVTRVLVGADARAAFEVMTSRHIRHLAVVDADGRAVGLLSFRAVAESCVRSAADQLRSLESFLGAGSAAAD